MGLFDNIKNAGRALMGYETKAAPPGLAGGLPGRSPYTDAFRRRAQPGPRQLLDNLRGFAYGCANLNAQAFAGVKLKLYVRQNAGEPTSRWPTSKPSRKTLEELYDNHPCLDHYVRKAQKLEEVIEHPLLTMFNQVNPWMNKFDLMKLLSLDLDTDGAAYWLVQRTGFGTPGEIWPLEAWRVRVIPSLSGHELIQGFQYTGARSAVTYAPDKLIQFREVTPHDPYATGHSPMRAAFESVELANELLAFESSIVTNRARPDMLISPTEPISRAMAQRMEARFSDKFRRGGAGGVLVGEHDMRYTPFAYSPVDLGIEAIRRACEETIAFCFRVPLSLIHGTEGNRAVADAGHYQHAKLCVKPRCDQVEQKINERLSKEFDERFIMAFENVVPADADRLRQDMVSELSTGVRSYNEIRAERGWPELPNADELLVPAGLVPIGTVSEMATAALAAARNASHPPGIGGKPSYGGQGDTEGASGKGEAARNSNVRMVPRGKLSAQIRKTVAAEFEKNLMAQIDGAQYWPED